MCKNENDGLVDDNYDDIPDYSGYCPACPECESTMKFSYQKSEFKCFDCGFIMDENDWDFDPTDEKGKPFVCSTCGGPWPSCSTSCKMFDD